MSAPRPHPPPAVGVPDPSVTDVPPKTGYTYGVPFSAGVVTCGTPRSGVLAEGRSCGRSPRLGPDSDTTGGAVCAPAVAYPTWISVPAGSPPCAAVSVTSRAT